MAKVESKDCRYMKRLFTLILFMFVATSLFAQGVEKHTVHYATHEGQQLMMDIYSTAYEGEPRPAMIFIFGGGFVMGQRDHEYYARYFERLAKEGIVVASIDYRLGLRNMKSGMSIGEMVATMQRAVDIAVEDTYAATNYLLEHGEAWGINPRMVMLSGSSAGAITAIQAEWQRCNGAPLAEVLPEDFSYAGVVACAGAIFSTKGKPKFGSKPAPMLLFHGTSDRNVPYDKSSIMGIGFYGSKHITKQLDRVKGAYLFYSAEYADHSMAALPLIYYTDIIMQFIRDYVYEGRALRVHVDVETIDGEKQPTRFGAMDYLKSNYSHRGL